MSIFSDVLSLILNNTFVNFEIYKIGTETCRQNFILRRAVLVRVP
jgi:hypothetical protein